MQKGQFSFTGERWLDVKCLILGLSYKKIRRGAEMEQVFRVLPRKVISLPVVLKYYMVPYQNEVMK